MFASSPPTSMTSPPSWTQRRDCRLKSDDEWKAELEGLGALSAYATAYRYPSPGGRRSAGPPADEVKTWLTKLSSLLTRIRRALTPTP